MEMILTGIENKNEYYTNHYLKIRSLQVSTHQLSLMKVRILAQVHIGYLDHLQVMSTGMIFLLWVIHIREYIEIRQYFQNAELMSAEEAAT